MKIQTVKCTWCKTWQLKFNPDKRETMRVTHQQDKSKESYTLDPNCEILKRVKNIKDLGITISYDLSWSDHIHEVVNKANKVLGVIKCVLGSNRVNEFSLLVRPTLEYAAPVWCPFLVKSVETGSRPKGGEMDYEKRCSISKWSPLKNRRLDFSLIECNKCIFSLSNLEFQDFFPVSIKTNKK